MSGTHDGRRRGILAIDTATSRVVIATGSPDGVADGLSWWAAGHRHGETLLPSIGRFLGEQNLRRSRLVGIVVGTGPGTFTGLRVGMATAKGMAHGLGIPLVGVSTAQALLGAAVAAGVERPVLLVPAGAANGAPGDGYCRQPRRAGDRNTVSIRQARGLPAPRQSIGIEYQWTITTRVRGWPAAGRNQPLRPAPMARLAPVFETRALPLSGAVSSVVHED